EKAGMLLQLLNEVEIEALPSDLPESISVDVTSLATVGDQLTVQSLKAPQGVTILNEPEQAIFRIDELVSEEALEQEAQEEAEAATASEDSTTEGTTETEKSESSTPSEEKTEE